MRIAALVAVLFVLASCQSTNPVKMSYSAPPSATQLGSGDVGAGRFVDDRGEPAKWLGAIRGGYGNPLKVLEVDDSVAAMVQGAFAQGIKARGGAGDAGKRYEVRGSIKKFDCSQYVRREAHAVVEVVVVETATGRERFRRSYRSDVVEGSVVNLATGIFASVDELRQTAENALREVVDKALDDPALRDALRA